MIYWQQCKINKAGNVLLTYHCGAFAFLLLQWKCNYAICVSSTLSQKRHDFRGRPVLKTNIYFKFLDNFCLKTIPAICLPTGINFGTTDFCKTLRTNYEFCKHRSNKDRTSLKRCKWTFMDGYPHRNPLNICNVPQYGRKKAGYFL